MAQTRAAWKEAAVDSASANGKCSPGDCTRTVVAPAAAVAASFAIDVERFGVPQLGA